MKNKKKKNKKHRRSSIPTPVEEKIRNKPHDEPQKKKQQQLPEPERRRRSLIPVPKPLDLTGVLNRREPLISPIPLPPGVVCIDPLPEDDSTKCYWSDFVCHLRSKEMDWQFTSSAMGGQSRTLVRHRCTLMNWLIEVAGHCKVSQETLYHLSLIHI